jgi:hypothetical protein
LLLKHQQQRRGAALVAEVIVAEVTAVVAQVIAHALLAYARSSTKR